MMDEILVKVNFHLLIGGNERDEQELDSHFDDYRTQLFDQVEFEGDITLTGENLPVVKAEDALPSLVKHVCFLSMPDLVANKSVVYRYYNHYGYLRLDPEGNQILVSGNGNPTVRVPRDEFLIALYNCGIRFIAFLERLKEKNDSGRELQRLIQFLTDQREVVVEAIASIGNKWSNP